MALGLALPSTGLAATERWDLNSTVGTIPPDYKSVVTSGHLIYDTGTSAPTDVQITANFDGVPYTFNGNRTGHLLFFSPDGSSGTYDRVFTINVEPLATGSGDTRTVRLHTGLCNNVENDKCSGINGAELTSNIPVTRQTPAATPTAIPTLTEWAMILMGMALAGAAALTLNARRRRV